MKVKELITKLLELRDMELDIIIRDECCDYDIDKVKLYYGRATMQIKDFEKVED